MRPMPQNFYSRQQVLVHLVQQGNRTVFVSKRKCVINLNKVFVSICYTFFVLPFIHSFHIAIEFLDLQSNLYCQTCTVTLGEWATDRLIQVRYRFNWL